jgi:chromosome segregation ATPase
MDNLALNLKSIQDQIDALSKQLNEAQNKKLTAEVHLQNEQQEYEALEKQLKELTGLNDMNEIEQYITNKTTELNNIIQDLDQVSNAINSQYTFSENDVQTVKAIVDKYNIPIGE